MIRTAFAPILTLALLAPLALAPSPILAEDWNQFRGPTGQGHSGATDLPQSWSERENILWKKPVAGHGWSSPLLISGRLFLTTAVEEKPGADKTDRSLRALCLDAASGEEIWNVEVFEQKAATAAKVHSKNSHASPTPVYEDGRLYVHFGHDGTACLDARSGKTLWRQDSLRYTPVHGNGGSPVIVGDLLVFSCDGASDPFVVALAKKNGKVKWRTPREVSVERPFSFSTPLLIEVDGRAELISAGSGAVIAYDPQSGRELWRCGYGEGYSIVPRPLFAQGLVYVCTGFNRANLMAIRPGGSGDVTDSHVAWTFSKAVPKNASPLIVGEHLYMVDDKGIASCLVAATGEVVWQERLGGNFSASPLYADGKLYCNSEEGVTTVIAPGERFEVLAKNEVGERTFATLVPRDGVLYLRGEEHLFCIGE